MRWQSGRCWRQAWLGARPFFFREPGWRTKMYFSYFLCFFIFNKCSIRVDMSGCGLVAAHVCELARCMYVFMCLCACARSVSTLGGFYPCSGQYSHNGPNWVSQYSSYNFSCMQPSAPKTSVIRTSCKFFLWSFDPRSCLMSCSIDLNFFEHNRHAGLPSLALPRVLVPASRCVGVSECVECYLIEQVRSFFGMRASEWVSEWATAHWNEWLREWVSERAIKHLNDATSWLASDAAAFRCLSGRTRFRRDRFGFRRGRFLHGCDSRPRLP